MKVRDVIESVSRNNQRRAGILLRNRFPGLSAEVVSKNVDALFRGLRGEILRRINSENARASFLTETEEQSVVAADVDDQVIGGRGISAHDFIGETLKMSDHRRRGGRNVDIIAKEISRNIVRQLNESAIETD